MMWPKGWPSPGRLWWLFQYNTKRGWWTAWYEYRIMPRILGWRVPQEFPLESRVEIHVLTSRAHWLYAAWMLASFFHATRRRWRVVFHDDGSCDGEILPSLARLFQEV